MSDQPKLPDIIFPMTGTDGNAFFLVGRARQLMRKSGCSQEQIDEFTKEANSSDYDHLLQTCISWFTVT